MADGDNTPQIKGLPPGAIVGPPIAQTAPPSGQIKGLPPGAVVGPPIQTPPTTSFAGTPGTEMRRQSGAPTMDPSVLKEAGEGVLGGILDTTAGIGGLIQKIPVIGPALIPEQGLQAESKVAESLQQTPSQQLGAAAETVGEFAAGDAALESGLVRLGKVAAKYPHVMELLEKFPKASKTIMKGTTTGAVQGGVQESRPGGEGTVEGAEHGAEGGALGSTVAEAVGAVVKPLAKATGVMTSAEEDITRAAQPGKRNVRFLQDWGLAKDRIAKEVEEDGKFKDLGEAADRIRDVRQNLWKNEVQPVIAKHANEELLKPPGWSPTAGTVATPSPIARAIRSRITPAMNRVSPENAAKIEAFAKKYDGPITVKEAEEDLEHLNAELTNEGYWKKLPDERAAAEKADPSIGAKSAAVGALRNTLYDHLELAGEAGIKDTKREYGAIANVEKEIRGQAPVAGRQRPLSLKQIIALASGHPLGIGAAFIDKIYNSPESLLNRAVSKTEPAGPVKAAVQDIASGAGTVAVKSAPAVGSIMFRASDGSVRKVNEDQWPEVQKIDPGAKQIEGGAPNPTQRTVIGNPATVPGMIQPGNLDLTNRPIIKNEDGTHSSEYSTSFGTDKGEVLVPTVVNGKFLTPDGKKPKPGSAEEKAMFKRAQQHYEKTGEHLGIFDTPEHADAYANIVHNRDQGTPRSGGGKK
jgi:hypothetical protein